MATSWPWECQSCDKDGKVEWEKNLDSLMALWNCQLSKRLHTLDLFLKKINLYYFNTPLSAANTLSSWPVYSACIHCSYSQKNILPNRNTILFLNGLKRISPPLAWALDLMQSSLHPLCKWEDGETQKGYTWKQKVPGLMFEVMPKGLQCLLTVTLYCFHRIHRKHL